jgi:Kiwa protein KwaB-like
VDLDFDLAGVRTTEFGIGRDVDDEDAYFLVPTGADVKVALREVAQDTLSHIEADEAGGVPYSPAEKYGSIEYVYIALDNPIVQRLRTLHEAGNLAIDARALVHPENLFCYFARFRDKAGRRLTAVRRSTQFKGMLHSRLIRIIRDTLELVPDTIFKLDGDFDLLISDTTIHVLRPSGLEFLGQLQASILAGVPANVAAISAELRFVKFDNISAYAQRHSRAARYLASIGSQRQAQGVSRRALAAACAQNGVTLTARDGKLTVQDSEVLDFLQVIDRRRYVSNLVPGSPERFVAPSRRKLE